MYMEGFPGSDRVIDFIVREVPRVCVVWLDSAKNKLVISNAELMVTVNAISVYIFVDEVMFMLVTVIECYFHGAYK